MLKRLYVEGNYQVFHGTGLEPVVSNMTRWLTLDPTELGNASNVLLVAPEVRRPMEDVFGDLLSALETTPDEVVGVTMAKPPADFVNPWRRALAGQSVDFSVVAATGQARSVAATNGDGTDATVTDVESPEPLSDLYRAVADRMDGQGEVVVCLHSLTHLLEYVDVERAFRFLHVLLSAARSADARVFCHVDGDIHDEETITELSTVFDLVVEFDAPRYAGGVGAGGP